MSILECSILSLFSTDLFTTIGKTARIRNCHYNVGLFYSEVPIIRPSMVLIESGCYNGQVMVVRPIYIGKCMSVLK